MVYYDPFRVFIFNSLPPRIGNEEIREAEEEAETSIASLQGLETVPTIGTHSIRFILQ